METKQIIETLNKALADTYALYLKTQNYHWNVTGPFFASFHALFEEQYEDLAGAVDEIAERIRILGAYAPGSFKEFEKLKSIEDAKEGITAMEMIEDLRADQDKVTQTLQRAFAVAQQEDDEGTTALLSDRMVAHEKNEWMLAATAAKE